MQAEEWGIIELSLWPRTSCTPGHTRTSRKKGFCVVWRHTHTLQHTSGYETGTTTAIEGRGLLPRASDCVCPHNERVCVCCTDASRVGECPLSPVDYTGIIHTHIHTHRHSETITESVGMLHQESFSCEVLKRRREGCVCE